MLPTSFVSNAAYWNLLPAVQILIYYFISVSRQCEIATSSDTQILVLNKTYLWSTLFFES